MGKTKRKEFNKTNETNRDVTKIYKCLNQKLTQILIFLQKKGRQKMKYEPDVETHLQSMDSNIFFKNNKKKECTIAFW